MNCVAFGHIATRLTQETNNQAASIKVKGRELKVGLDKDAFAMTHALTPLGRPGSPQEAAGAVFLLCIPESDYITGQVLLCSGGLVM